MLSSIHPLGERVRGNRFAVTAAWLIAGSVAGGGALGGAVGLVGALARTVAGWPGRVAAAVVLAAALAALASDLRLSRFRLPTSRRQVDEDWLDRYRGWVYGVGYGAQLGVGFATIITTGAVHLTFVLALLSASGWSGALIGGTFGLVRGLAVLPAGRVQTPEALVALHRRVAARERVAHRAAVAVLAAVAAIGAAALVGGA
jgi:hypothetical protein